MFGKCKICLEKDVRISELKEQISFLRSIAYPKPYSPLVTLEANRILDGANSEILEVDTSDNKDLQKEFEQAALEHDLILSGNY